MDGTHPLGERFGFEGDSVAWDVAGDGPPLVLIHGTPFSAHVWHRVLPHLAARHRVYRYDLLGYGQSAKRAGQDVSLGVQNRLLGALLDHWQLDRPAVLAHDFGGATALRAHLLDGRDFSRLMLVDPVAISPWGSPFVQHVRAHEAAFAGLPAAIQHAVVAAYIAGAAARPLPAEALAPYVAPWTGPQGQPAFYRQIAQMDRAHTDAIADGLGAVRCTVRLLWGEEDAWIPVDQGRRLARMMPGAEFSTVPGAGHLVQEDAPEAIVAAAIRFFEG